VAFSSLFLPFCSHFLHFLLFHWKAAPYLCNHARVSVIWKILQFGFFAFPRVLLAHEKRLQRGEGILAADYEERSSCLEVASHRCCLLLALIFCLRESESNEP
jgi:hypothetical protein